ncbi:peptidylprolyl isomerase [Halobaculum sp. CBA1158]|uniref:FKBP-type peptidyl-prolyl cis-trans isomerase n=1 Tax=Halobaculum sp. CBA1158 TaxID=2904243 RepID=UPI001F3E8B1D|nr:peptidylprolyl isomerase [Halobaculum sp. CBA1158]UIO98857.1 peptidylprolyl isomerase [Halobaculum sp. CBA1158]
MSEEEQAEAAEAADAGDEASEEVDDEESTDDGIQNGDFVRLEYTVRTVPGEDEDEGRVVDTTSQEVAEEAGIDDDEYDFSPRTIVVGEGHVFASVDDDLIGREVGDSNVVAVPADEAFGEFDPDDVRTVSAEKIPEDDRYPGAQVTIDGDQGYVETVIGGRSRVDFNHPLAGDDLEYDYEILDLVDDDEEKAAAMIGMYLQETPDVRIEEETVEEEVPVEVHEDEETGEVDKEMELQEVTKRSLYIEATPMMQMNQQWMFSKQQIAQDIMGRLGLDRVVIEEVIDGSGGGMMGGMGGMMGGMGGMGGGDVEEALDDVDMDDVDVDADELVEELEDAEE